MGWKARPLDPPAPLYPSLTLAKSSDTQTYNPQLKWLSVILMWQNSVSCWLLVCFFYLNYEQADGPTQHPFSVTATILSWASAEPWRIKKRGGSSARVMFFGRERIDLDLFSFFPHHFPSCTLQLCEDWIESVCFSCILFVIQVPNLQSCEFYISLKFVFWQYVY